MSRGSGGGAEGGGGGGDGGGTELPVISASLKERAALVERSLTGAAGSGLPDPATSAG